MFAPLVSRAFSDAALLGASQAGFRLAAVREVSEVAVVGGGVEVTLASTAVAMAAQSGGGGLPSAGGPGKWVQVNESMSERARAYQAQVTGAPEGSAYRLQEGDTVVDFDGFDPVENVLLEAKGPGYEKFLKADMTMKDFYRGFGRMLDQARRQSRLANDTRIRWNVAEKRFADFLREAFQNEGLSIEVVQVSPAR
ncbi:hypothetical protein FOF48_34325 [Corallococcus sp. Z5C101001]|nr:hypothetical protein FOF48_34325 [Corallococcus sp. Z5C101001]